MPAPPCTPHDPNDVALVERLRSGIATSAEIINATLFTLVTAAVDHHTHDFGTDLADDSRAAVIVAEGHRLNLELVDYLAAVLPHGSLVFVEH